MGKMRKLDIGDRKWIAAIITGEGHIEPEKTRVRILRGKKYCDRYPKVSVASTDRDTVEKVREIVGAGSISKKRVKPTGIIEYEYEVGYGTAYDILEQSCPYMTGTKLYKGKRYTVKDLCDWVLNDPLYRKRKFSKPC